MKNATIHVAAYCRVSTDSNDQINSFESQQQFFRMYIQTHPNWTLFAIYADEGITGTSTKKRAQFNRMIQDAKAGCFQMILTKEVSRFSRNLLDTITYTRDLRERNISVLFLTDGIDTRDPDAELRLSIMASIAQEESRRTSTRVTWGQTRQMEKGVVFGRSLLGYHVKNGQIFINPLEAGIVQMIFRKYAVEGKGTTKIAADLEEKGFLTSYGNTHWTASGILRILKNEKYVGDLVQKKTYTPNYLTHEKKENRGAVSMIHLPDHHPPIISRELWDAAQQRLQISKTQKGPTQQYPFSQKIRCGCCGNFFKARQKYHKDGSSYLRWCCNRSCGVGRIVRNDDAVQMVSSALRSLNLDPIEISDRCSEMLEKRQREPISFQQEQSKIEYKRSMVLDHYFDGNISEKDRDTLLERYDKQISLLKKQINDAKVEFNMDHQSMQTYIAEVLMGTSQNERLYGMLVEEITVFQDRHIELRLKDLDAVFCFA